MAVPFSYKEMVEVRFLSCLPGIVGRVDDCSCLENNRTERYRGFESYTIRVKMRFDELGQKPTVAGMFIAAVLFGLGKIVWPKA